MSICILYFELILTYNTKTWTLTNRNNNRIQAVVMEFFRHIEGKKEGLQFEINFLDRKLYSKFVNRVRREMITMACPCKKNG
jgi:hypothetical protein